MTTTAADTDTFELLRRAVDRVDQLVAGIRDPHWSDPTPCPGWTVRALVNHVAVEDLWAGELFAGRTIAEVGSRLDGDQLGAVPFARWQQAAGSGLAAAAAPGAMTATVHLSFGDVPGSEYAMQLAADHLVHAWDLAVALGRPAALDPADAQTTLDWFGDREDAYRAAGLIGPRTPTAPDADAGTRLLAAYGRAPAAAPLAVVERFNAAFNRHDVPAVMALMSEDCVFEGTTPPDGRRYEGAAAVRGAWAELFEAAPEARFEVEETFACGERVVVRWLYRWGPEGSGRHVRGVDVFRVAGGLVTEKLAYVKG
jgi:uncharacterized protein (TIGR03086 family)